ncbi:MAG: tetratricopeptide repeat protein [Vampirovibrionales bacterium]|nr:tetratricopeptide repeat protein [Vampirovibrionales bacterium]
MTSCFTPRLGAPSRLLLQALVITAMLGPVCPGASPPAWGQLGDYAYYYAQGNSFFEKGELTKAIEMYEKAITLAEGPSIPIAYNNLAAIYMRRGNYFIGVKQLENALSDFRRAYYLLEPAWPDGMERSEKQDANRKISRENLKIGYGNLQISLNDASAHRELAKKLRFSGKFQEAVVEYARVLELSPSDADSAKAMGDLFNVLGVAEKSKKYYAIAVKNGAGGQDGDLLTRLADAQSKSGETDAAVQSLNKALEADPNNQTALRQLEDIWMRELKYNPKSVLAHANLAGVFQKRKLYDQALKAYNNAELYASQDPATTLDVKKLIRLNMGTLYQEMRDFPMAEKAYTTVLQIEPGNRLANYYLAAMYRDSGRVDQAMGQYRRLLAADPDNTDAMKDLLELIRRQPPEKAAPQLQAYADQFAGNALAQSRVGEEFHAMKNYESAAAYYQRALAINPELASANANLGVLLQSQGKLDEALPYLQKAARLDPQNQTVTGLLKDAQSAAGQDALSKAGDLLHAGRYEDAAGAYQRALQTAGADTPEARASYGIALQNLQRLPEAIAQYQKAIAAAPDKGDFRYYLATAYHQSGDLTKAAAEYRRALAAPSLDDALKPQAQQALDGLTQAHAADTLNKAVDAYNRKAYAQALTLVEQALRESPRNATALYYRAMIYSDQGKLPQAISGYQDTLRADPGFKDAYFGLAVALEKKSDRAGARGAFQKFVELSAGQPDDDFTRYARERLKAL